MRIIPAIDIIEGKCVRLTKGDYITKKVYNENPLEVAKKFEEKGIKYLHLVDLDGAKSKHVVNYKTLEQIASKTSLKIDFGGGIKSNEDLKIAFESGADQITGGSIAVSNQPLFISWLQKYGEDKIILGADCEGENIAINGWQKPTKNNVFDFIGNYKEQGIENVICTDIEKDGMLQGPSLKLYENLLSRFPDIKLIASGGVTSNKDIKDLQKIGIEGVIIGKAIYEDILNLKML